MFGHMFDDMDAPASGDEGGSGGSEAEDLLSSGESEEEGGEEEEEGWSDDDEEEEGRGAGSRGQRHEMDELFGDSPSGSSQEEDGRDGSASGDDAGSGEEDEEGDEAAAARHAAMLEAVTGGGAAAARRKRRVKEVVVTEAYPESAYNLAPSGKLLPECACMCVCVCVCRPPAATSAGPHNTAHARWQQASRASCMRAAPSFQHLAAAKAALPSLAHPASQHAPHPPLPCTGISRNTFPALIGAAARLKTRRSVGCGCGQMTSEQQHSTKCLQAGAATFLRRLFTVTWTPPRHHITPLAACRTHVARAACPPASRLPLLTLWPPPSPHPHALRLHPVQPTTAS